MGHPISDGASERPDAFMPRLSRRVVLSDNTLRDGEQAPGIAFDADEKVELARAIGAIGVDMLSAGFPAVSQAEAEMCRAIVDLELDTSIRVLARLRQADIDKAIDTGADIISVWAPISDLHMARKLDVSEDELARRVFEAISQIVKSGRGARMGLEDASRAPIERILRFARIAQDAGAQWLGISDTCGVLTPTVARALIERLRPEVRCVLGVHFHDNLGLATANSLAALEAGADLVDGTFSGIGEGAGNLRLEEIVTVLAVTYGCDLPIDLRRLPALVEQVARAARRPIPPERPIFGELAFTHESGIHVAGVLEDPAMYEPFPPERVGRQHRFAWGKHSGLTGVKYLLEREGLKLEEGDTEMLLAKIKDRGQRKQPVQEDEIVTWARELAARGPARAEAQD